ncbi:adhesin [Cutibacterium granulosum]|uniref:adhesin n=1 Tax=Cutibacterium TaxID=1912216 RepID=UPI0023F7B9DC|nr:adhesin [Cutibacterium granulosum]
MTTHKDTTKQQHHHAPLNGLIIGTIVGVAWPTVFGILHVRETLVLVPKAYPPVFTMSFIFPLVGWLTGLWERKVYACDDPKNRRLKTKIIGAVMATFTGVLMFSTHFALVNDELLLNMEAAVHPLPLAVFPCAGLILSDIGIRLKKSEIPFTFSMSIASTVILFITVAVWFYVFGITKLSLSSHS